MLLEIADDVVASEIVDSVRLAINVIPEYDVVVAICIENDAVCIMTLTQIPDN